MSASVNGRVRRFFIDMSMALLIAAALAWRPADAQPARVVGQDLMVRGYIATQVGGANDAGIFSRVVPARDVYIPAVEVFLADPNGAQVGVPVRTDLSARFTLYAPAPGRYKICWKAPGFAAGCEAKFVSLGNSPQFVSTVRIPVERREGFVVLTGKVMMADGSAPRMLEPLANINAFATVTLLDSVGKRHYVARVNNFGEYLLPQVPVKADIKLEARMENAKLDYPILKEAELERELLNVVNLRFANHPPVLEPIVPLDANTGKRVQVAAPGSTIAFKAVGRDADGDPLQYTWELVNGAGTLSATTGASTTWQLPAGPGQFQIALIAWDGKGGYAKSEALVRAGTTGVPFSGIVRENSGATVAGATIEIGSATATTDASGIFQMNVAESDRYVFNIRKQGYGFYSKIYDRGMTGGIWTLTRATVQTADPTQPISAVNRREPADCPGPRSARLDWKDFPAAAKPQFQDGKGNVIFPDPRKGLGALKQVNLQLGAAATREKQALPPLAIKTGNRCGPGISVAIPADALVDADGNPPAGNVQVSLSTIDLISPEQMPGDYTVVLPGNDTRVMESFGAGSIEITAGGKRYNLRPGKQAEVRIPVDAAQLAAGGPIPATIPILYYDEKLGVWHQEGTMPLQGTGAARAYVAKVKHFSTINGDTLKQDQACVRVLSPQPGMPAQFNLEVTIPQPNGNAPKVKSQLMNNAPGEHAVYNLPLNTNIVLVPSPATPNSTPFGVFVVNTGQKQNPTTPNQPQGPPYSACSTQVTLSQNFAIPTAPLSGEFLHGLTSFSAANLDELNPGDPSQVAIKNAIAQATADYYTQVDPRNKRPTLKTFRQVNGFEDNVGNPLPGVTNVKYANSGDLGFGRDMYCQSQVASDNQTDYACYVSNYGDVTTPDLQDAIDAATGGPPVATVAMEYSRIESQNGVANEFDDPARTVKFYVYDKTGTQFLAAANLDGHGARPVPQLCMVCHGGALVKPQTNVNGQPVPVFAARDDVKLGSVFVPFDLRYYTFGPAPFTKAQQQANYKTLNTTIVRPVAVATGDTAIQDVVDAMYSGNAANQHEDFTVAGWQPPAAPEPAKATFYKDALSNACRMCHTAQPFANLRFSTANDFLGYLPQAGSRVCNQHVMPHADRTHEIFWGIEDPTVVIPATVPNMGAQLEIFGTQFGPAADWIGVNNNPPTYLCGTHFTSGGTTPISFYEQNIQTKWSFYGCTGCHGNSAGLNLGDGVSYGNIVNVNSTELGTMKRVKPSDSANSYLYHKIVGDQGSVGGSGGRMPQGCSGASCMSASDIAAIKNWIDVRGADGP